MLYKKIISVIVSAAMTVGCGSGIIPVAADISYTVAADEVYTSGDWDYVLVDDGAKIVAYHNDDNYKYDVSLPTELGGERVTEVAEGIFDHTVANRLTIPDTSVRFHENWIDITNINVLYCDDFEFVFYRDGPYKPVIAAVLAGWNKKEINKNDSSTSGDDMPVTASAGELYDVVIPDTVAGYKVSIIEPGVFQSACNIRSVRLPDTLMYLTEYGFRNSSLESVNIPKSVQFIPRNSFADCASLKNVEFHDDIILIDQLAFDDTYSLIPDELSDKIASVTSNGSFTEATKTVGSWQIQLTKYNDKELTVGLYQYTGNDTVLTIPKEVGGFEINTSLRKSVFERNDGTKTGRNVKEIVFEEGVKYIPNLSYGSMEKVTLPDSATELRGQFQFCNDLTSIVIPPNIKKLSGGTFSYSSNLSEIIFEGDEITIDGFEFGGTALKSLDLPGNCYFNPYGFPETLEEIHFRAGDSVIFRGAEGLTQNLKKITFSPDIKELTITSNSFRNSAIKDIEFPHGKINFEFSAFRGNKNISELVIYGDADIASNAFSDCPELEKVTLKGNCTVADHAFVNCPKLAEAEFDLSLGISGRCFDNCPNLFTINGAEVVAEDSAKVAPEFEEYVFANCHTASGLGFMDRLVTNRVKEIVAEYTDDSMSDIEKVRVLHDWVCDNTVYAPDNEDYLGNHVDSAVIMDGVAVCEGYSSMYNLLLHEAGIESCYVCTRNHAWNMVKLGGYWFHVDTTWDDINDTVYDWFLCPDSEMQTGSHANFELKLPSSLHSFQVTELPAATRVMGDLDEDTIVTYDDAVSLRQRIIDGEPYDVVSDVNYDGVADAADIAAILEMTPDNAYDMGDVNGDGKVDSSDASAVLAEYSRLSVSSDPEFTAGQTLAADLNADGRTDSTDASRILVIYSKLSTGATEPVSRLLINKAAL